IHVHRRDLADAFRPRPVRKDMRHRMVRPPVGLVEIEPIFLETGKIDNPVVGTSRSFEWRGLSEVVPARPDEFSADKRIAVLGSEFLFGGISPRREIQIVRTDLPVGGLLAGAGGSGGA